MTSRGRKLKVVLYPHGNDGYDCREMKLTMSYRLHGKPETSSGNTDQLIAEAMALPLAERVSLAQALWESIDADLPEADERAAIAEAIRGLTKVPCHDVAGRTHEEVMEAARFSRKLPARFQPS